MSRRRVHRSRFRASPIHWALRAGRRFGVSTGLFSSALAQTSPTLASAPVAVASTDASAATPKTGSARFFELHESFLKRAKTGPIGVLFLGDSITEGWTKAPHIWDLAGDAIGNGLTDTV